MDIKKQNILFSVTEITKIELLEQQNTKTFDNFNSFKVVCK